MSDDFYAGGGLSQGARGVHPRDRAEADADAETEVELSECRNPDCGLLHHDGPGGCCSTACAVEVGHSDDREAGRDGRRAAQEASR